jgi:hypothetical protein
MKKINSLICVLFLLAVLVGNAFAGDVSGNGFFGFFDNAINTVGSFLTSADNCETRQCQTCRPTPDGGSDCRPTN